MESKREVTSVDCRALVGELRAYAGAVVDKAYLYPDGLVRLRMRDHERGRIELLIQVGEVKRAHVTDPGLVPDAPDRPPNFAKMLRNRIAGANLAEVEQYEFDRILVFAFERDDANTTIVAELFGDGNVAVCDANGEVIDSLDTVRLQSRTVAPGSPYEYPETRLDPFSVDYETFEARMDDSDADLVRTLATRINFGGTYAEELCTRAGVEKTRDIDDATDEDYAALYDAIGRLDERLSTGDLDPRLYRSSGGSGEAVSPAHGGSKSADEDQAGRVVDATPIPLAEYDREGLDGEPYDTFNAALDAYFRLRSAQEDAERGGGGSDRPDFEEKIEKQERIVQQQAGAIEEFEEEAAAERTAAEACYANYDLVDEILTTVREARERDTPWDEIEARFEEGAEQGIAAAEAVVDVDGPSGTITIEVDDQPIDLDPSMGVEKNADRHYREAKRIEEKRAGAVEALEETRGELERLRKRRDEWERDDAAEGDEAGGDEAEPDGETDSAGALSPTAEAWLDRPSIPVRKPEHWYERFRWFHTSDGFLVLGGRNAEDNEELVEKYLEPGDRFLHAQASGGPATILKATGPSEPSREVDFPASTLQQAAQFAVSYSSVWKDGHFSGDAYAVEPDQVSKTPESGEYLETGGFAIRGDRNYFEDVSVGVAVGIQCSPETRVIGGPPDAIEPEVPFAIRVEPGQFAQADVGKRIYRRFRERFSDTSFVRSVASPDRIQHFLPPGTSRIAGE